MELFLFIVILLIVLAVMDLIVGVSNDAVNFLNSSIGSRVAPVKYIMIIACLGIMAGVTFSSGMMEVARKGIFHPQLFTLTEIMAIFLAVMITDILLLDLFNTFGLPTSTTVSIVFELLGAAVAVSLIKIGHSDNSYANIVNYINTDKAIIIISGILISVVVAFIAGALVQFLTRVIFTFDYKSRLKRYGALWGGFALSMIIYFILVKGAKGASFISPDSVKWIDSNKLLIVGVSFVFSAIVLQMLLLFTEVNILKPVVLIGTFALAMAFAANDLVNFVGVPLAGLTSYMISLASSNPAEMTMGALQKPIQTNTIYLLIAGIIMVLTLWSSKKAKGVIKTSVNLSSQDEEVERFSSSHMSRSIVRLFASVFEIIKSIIPDKIQKSISHRLDIKHYKPDFTEVKDTPSFDLLRASVNLMVASALVSFATSLKLPLSTTYVTFMVAMGTSLSDQAWGRESAVYRVAGVLTVIGGWFLTALMAFTIALGFAFIIYFFSLPGIIVLIIAITFIIWKNHHLHIRRQKDSDDISVFNLKHVRDAKLAVKTSFEHSAYFLKKVKEDLDISCNGLFCHNRLTLRKLKKDTHKIQKWANIIIANIFKTLRLLSKQDVRTTQKYAQIINAIQEIAESHTDTIMRSFTHIDNNHKGLLPSQIEELNEVWNHLSSLIDKSVEILLRKGTADYKSIVKIDDKINKIMKAFDEKQIGRIQDDISKTRLSILYYGKMRDFKIISNNIVKLLGLFNDSFKINYKK